MGNKVTDWRLACDPSELLLATAVLGYGLPARCAFVAWSAHLADVNLVSKAVTKMGELESSDPCYFARRASSMLASTVTARVPGPNRGRTGIMKRQRKRGSSVWPKSGGLYVGRVHLCHVILYTCHQNSRESAKPDWQND
jgi:hypothetical protein